MTQPFSVGSAGDLSSSGTDGPSKGSEERRVRQVRAPRFAAQIPVVFHEGSLRVTGITRNVSASGALITNSSGQPSVGTMASLRLLALRSTLRTQGRDSIELVAAVVRHEGPDFAVEFQGERSQIGALLERAFGRGAVERSG